VLKAVIEHDDLAAEPLRGDYALDAAARGEHYTVKALRQHHRLVANSLDVLQEVLSVEGEPCAIFAEATILPVPVSMTTSSPFAPAEKSRPQQPLLAVGGAA
jgi:hypothetical protein